MSSASSFFLFETSCALCIVGDDVDLAWRQEAAAGLIRSRHAAFRGRGALLKLAQLVSWEGDVCLFAPVVQIMLTLLMLIR